MLGGCNGKGWEKLKKSFCALILFLLSVTIIFGDTISIYKYDDGNAAWVLVNQVSIASAQASESFSTTMIPGNVGGFIPVSLWKSQYGKVEIKLEITQSLTARISFSPYLGATVMVNGGWVTDDLYVGLKSNDTLNFDYAISGNDTYHHLNVGNASIPSTWEKSSNVDFQRIRITAGNNELYLYLGFHPDETGAFVSSVIVDTYVVPDI
jgi:hypothetical protein